jgi:hypothetical protein
VIWPRGHSGNPAGRPKGAVNLATRQFRDALAPLAAGPCISGLEQLITDPEMLRSRPDVVLRAIELTFRYVYGRPRDADEAQVSQHLHLHDDEARESLAIFKEVLAASPERICEIYAARAAGLRGSGAPSQ